MTKIELINMCFEGAEFYSEDNHNVNWLHKIWEEFEAKAWDANLQEEIDAIANLVRLDVMTTEECYLIDDLDATDLMIAIGHLDGEIE